MPGTVLIIEDEAFLAGLLKDILESAGYQPVFAPASRAAQRAVEVQPVAIVMDYLMPGMDGSAVMAQLKTHFPAGTPPVILVTGLSNAKELAEELGVFAYLRKPFDVDNFVRITADAVASREN